MRQPTVHYNGTDRATLGRQYRNAVEALQLALDALQAAAPHGRDYYPQPGDAFLEAHQEHASRRERLQSVQAELQAILEGLDI